MCKFHITFYPFMTITSLDVNFGKALISNDREELVDLVEFNFDPDSIIAKNPALSDDIKHKLLNSQTFTNNFELAGQ